MMIGGDKTSGVVAGVRARGFQPGAPGLWRFAGAHSYPSAAGMHSRIHPQWSAGRRPLVRATDRKRRNWPGSARLVEGRLTAAIAASRLLPLGLLFVPPSLTVRVGFMVVIRIASRSAKGELSKCGATEGDASLIAYRAGLVPSAPGWPPIAAFEHVGRLFGRTASVTSDRIR